VLDSSFSNVDTLLTLAQFDGYQANVVLDNVRIDNVKSGVFEGSKEIYAGGSKTIKSWIVGNAYTDANPSGVILYGETVGPRKHPSLLDSQGKFFEKDKPQYEKLASSDFINVLDYGVSNTGQSPQGNVEGINKALQVSASQGKVLVFPAGIYQVDDTIIIPKGARLVGVLWPQIMNYGPLFESAVKLKFLAK
jgi:glucan 1,3-beta-glucosidase